MRRSGLWKWFGVVSTFAAAIGCSGSAEEDLEIGSTELSLCAASDVICDGLDNDCDGQIDEDKNCTGQPVAIRMEGGASDYFGMPWPSDHRRHPDGTLKLNGYPKGIDFFGLIQEGIDVSQPKTIGFGMNTAAFFTVTGNLDPASFPAAEESIRSNSPVMLVNLASGERVPVLVDYKSAPGAARPARLLTVMPYPGFSLVPSSKYAVILFDKLAGTNSRVAKAPLLAALRANNRGSTGLNATDFSTLRSHLVDVDAYVSAQTGFAPSEVAAFAVYTTQGLGTELAGALLSMMFRVSDTEILNRISNVTVDRSCGACPSSGACEPAELTATIQVPNYQTELQLDANPLCAIFVGNCLVTSGGDIQLDAQGFATLQRWEPNVQAKILVPCASDQPAAGWPIVVRADGTGGTYDRVTRVADWYRQANRPFNQAGISIVPYQTGDRVDQALVTEIQETLQMFGITMPAQTIRGAVAYFFLNPVFVRNNAIQGALEQLYLKRVMGLLGQVAAQAGVTASSLNLPSASTPFKTDPNRGTITSQSQGSSIAPLAAAFVPPFGFRNLHMNAGAGLVHETVVHRGNIRPAFEALFSLDPGELDHFHPAAHLVQTLVEAGDITNYARYVRADNILVTAGAEDGCTPREGTIAFATGLQRAGKIAFGSTVAAFGGSIPDEPWLESLRVLLSTPITSWPIVSLPPPTAYLSNAESGLFVFLPGGHDMNGTEKQVGAFLSDLARGARPTMAAPPYEPHTTSTCSSRVE